MLSVSLGNEFNMKPATQYLQKEDVIGRPAMLSDELETFLGTEQLALQRAL